MDKKLKVKMMIVGLLIVPMLCFVSAIVTGIFFEMLQTGIMLTIAAGMIPMIGSAIFQDTINELREKNF